MTQAQRETYSSGAWALYHQGTVVPFRVAVQEEGSASTTRAHALRLARQVWGPSAKVGERLHTVDLFPTYGGVHTGRVYGVVIGDMADARKHVHLSRLDMGTPESDAVHATRDPKTHALPEQTSAADVVRPLLSTEPKEFGTLAALAGRHGLSSAEVHTALTALFKRGEATITYGKGWHVPLTPPPSADPEPVPADTEPAVLTLERSQVEDAAHAEMTRHFLAGRTAGMVPAEPFGSEHGGTYWAQAWGRDEWRHWVTLPMTEADARRDADDPIRAVRETIGKALQAATDVIDDHIARAGFAEEEASATMHAFLSAQVVYRLAWDLGLETLHDPFPAFPTADPTSQGSR